MKTQDKPTMKTLEQYVLQLQREAQRKIAADPYAQPYFPNWKPEAMEGNLKKLVQRAVKEHIIALVDVNGLITEEEKLEIQANGPALAIEVLRIRAAVADGEARRHAERASKSLAHLAGLHAREARRLQDRRASLSPGRRIDNALASLSSVSMVPASCLDTDRVCGGESDRVPKWGGDQFGATGTSLASVRAKAVRLAQELEALVDECKTRDLGAAA